MTGGPPARITVVPAIPPEPAKHGRLTMIRKACLALAASLMTFGAFSATGIVMTSGGAGTVQAA